MVAYTKTPADSAEASDKAVPVFKRQAKPGPGFGSGVGTAGVSAAVSAGGHFGGGRGGGRGR